MKKFFLIIALLSISVRTTSAQQQGPLFLEKRIDRLKALLETQCAGGNSSRRICDITAFRMQQINKQIQLFLEREAERKAKTKEIQQDSAMKQAVIDLTNQERKKNGLPSLTYNQLLEKSAQAHTEDMVARDYFDHTNPEGLEPVDRIKMTGYLQPFDECTCSKSYTVGENIATGQKTAEEVVKDWMESPKHRENILNSEFTEIGIGKMSDTWAQNFGNISLVK